MIIQRRLHKRLCGSRIKIVTFLLKRVKEDLPVLKNISKG